MQSILFFLLNVITAYKVKLVHDTTSNPKSICNKHDLEVVRAVFTEIPGLARSLKNNGYEHAFLYVGLDNFEPMVLDKKGTLYLPENKKTNNAICNYEREPVYAPLKGLESRKHVVTKETLTSPKRFNNTKNVTRDDIKNVTRDDIKNVTRDDIKNVTRDDIKNVTIDFGLLLGNIKIESIPSSILNK